MQCMRASLDSTLCSLHPPPCIRPFAPVQLLYDTPASSARTTCCYTLYKVVHIMDNTAVLVRSNDVLAASNVHFVVHHNAKLVLSAKNAIVLDRHEV